MGWVRQARSWYIYVYCCINLFVFPPLVVFSFSAFNLYMPAQMSNQWVWTPNEIKLICLSYARSALILSHSLLSFFFQITLVLLGSGFLLQVSIPTIEGASKLQKLAFNSILHNTCGKLVLNIDWWLWIWRIYSLTSTAHQILFLICPQQALWPFFNLDLNVVLCKLGQSKAKAK